MNVEWQSAALSWILILLVQWALSGVCHFRRRRRHWTKPYDRLFRRIERVLRLLKNGKPTMTHRQPRKTVPKGARGD
jgi:hypothetical protein